MSQNQSPGFQQTLVSPLLAVRGGSRAVEFYEQAFGAEVIYLHRGEEDSLVARLAVAGAEFWLSDEAPEHGNFSPQTLGGSTVRLLLIVDDPDEVFRRAIQAGAKEVSPVAEQHGWRTARLVDPFGHHWEIAKPLR